MIRFFLRKLPNRCSERVGAPSESVRLVVLSKKHFTIDAESQERANAVGLDV